MRKTSNESIIEKLLSINPNNKVIKIYREFQGGRVRIYVDYICGECGSTLIRINWDSIKKKKTKYCKKCKVREKKYDVNFIENELFKLGFKWLNKEEYVDASSSLKTECLKCGKIASANVTNRIVDGRQCSRCIGHDVKTIEEFKQEVFDLEGNNYTVLSNEYINSHEKNILMKHNECGHKYFVSRNNFIGGIIRTPRRCPYCNKSKGEKKIENFLINNNILFEPQKEFKDLIGVGNGLLSYDFYLPQYNLLIEYQGEYHDGSVSCQSKREFEQQQEHDKRKREYAKKHDINLLEIWYWDFNNIEDILNKELYNYGGKS